MQTEDTKIADITYAFDNEKMLTLLIERNEQLCKEKVTKSLSKAEINHEIETKIAKDYIGQLNREECKNFVIKFFRNYRITLSNLGPDLENFLMKMDEQNDSKIETKAVINFISNKLQEFEAL